MDTCMDTELVVSPISQVRLLEWQMPMPAQPLSVDGAYAGRRHSVRDA